VLNDTVYLVYLTAFVIYIMVFSLHAFVKTKTLYLKGFKTDLTPS